MSNTKQAIEVLYDLAHVNGRRRRIQVRTPSGVVHNVTTFQVDSQVCRTPNCDRTKLTLCGQETDEAVTCKRCLRTSAQHV